ncbi:MAG TPA: hypothetical protein VHU40_11025 [Polyangia bacterium]|nr:hypothetical protein [Polyangia bacterium]
MNPAPSDELADRLGRAEAALNADDLEAADAHLASAADLCRRLQAAGLGIPPQELATLRALAERCGTSLISVGERLNAASQRDENHRRGIVSYHNTLTR